MPIPTNWNTQPSQSSRLPTQPVAPTVEQRVQAAASAAATAYLRQAAPTGVFYFITDSSAVQPPGGLHQAQVDAYQRAFANRFNKILLNPSSASGNAGPSSRAPRTPARSSQSTARGQQRSASVGPRSRGYRDGLDGRGYSFTDDPRLTAAQNSANEDAYGRGFDVGDDLRQRNLSN